MICATFCCSLPMIGFGVPFGATRPARPTCPRRGPAGRRHRRASGCSVIDAGVRRSSWLVPAPCRFRSAVYRGIGGVDDLTLPVSSPLICFLGCALERHIDDVETGSSLREAMPHQLRAVMVPAP